jgi:putative copper export protein
MSIPGDAMGLVLPITSTLTNGKYTVAWRTASADGHPITGKFSFVVAVPTPVVAPPTTGVDPGARRRPSPVANSAFGSPERTMFSTSARWAELVALLTLIGAVVFQLFVLPASGFAGPTAADASDRARRLAHAVLVLFMVTTLWRLFAQADLLAGAQSRGAAMMSVVRDTQWGRAWAISAIGAALSTVGLLAARRVRWGWAIAGVGVVAICFGESLTGHAAALPRGVAIATGVDVAHLLGAGAWLGGLVAVLFAGLPASKRGDEIERRAAGQRLVRAYHKSALQCVALVFVTAVVAAWLRIPSVADLWSTAYGRMLLIKFALVVGVLGFGWFHWKTVVTPEWNDDTRFRFARSATAELLIGAAVVAATAILVSTALPGN